MARIEATAAEAAIDAHVVVIATEWPEFAELDWAEIAATMAAPNVVDARNLLDAAAMRQLGFAYEGLGRRRPGTEPGQPMTERRLPVGKLAQPMAERR